MAFDLGTGIEGASTGAEAGFAFGPVGAVVGGVIGGVTGGLLGGKAKKQQKKAKQALKNIQTIQRRVQIAQIVGETVRAQAAVNYQFAVSGEGIGSSGVQGQKSSVTAQGASSNVALQYTQFLQDRAGQYAAKSQSTLATFDMLKGLAQLVGQIKGLSGQLGQLPGSTPSGGTTGGGTVAGRF